MKLYYSPGACSLSPHIVLREGNFSFSLEKVDLRAGKFSGGEFSKVNPKGYVPALEIGEGQLLTEGPAILQFLADQKPEAKLLPASGMERYQAIEWIAFISSEIHKTFGALWNPAAPEETKAAARDLLGKRFEFVNQQLGKSEYLLGSQFSAPDAYLFTVLGWADFLKMSLKPWINIQPFMARMSQRPKVFEALKAEGLLS